MDKTLQSVLENYPKFIVEKHSSPSYVKMYTKNSREVVMVYGKNKQSLTTNNADTNGKSKKEIDELELTGSPLKLDLSLHAILDDTLISDEPQLWKKDEAGHAPINIETAREITNHINKQRDTLPTEESIPVWALINPSSNGKPLLITSQSDKQCFARGIVTYEETTTVDEVDLDQLVEDYAKMEGLTADMINTTIDCKYLIAGISYGSHNTDELLNAPHSGVTELHCDWAGRMLQTPFISCKVNFEQEVIVGHLASPCNAIWKSVTALYNMNQLLVDMTAAGIASVNLETAVIRNITPGTKRTNVTKRLNNLLNETETYAYTAECPAGGCICVTEDTTSLHQCLSSMNKHGSSNDFVYKLWDVLRDCETAEEIITLLIQALKFISLGKIRPFIDANNKTYLSKLVLKLSRGHSQAGKVLKNLRASPPQALSLVAQVGAEKTMWEYTRVMSLLEHSFFIAGIWNADARSHESVEQINQTIQDMTMSGGDFTLNPFESLTNPENSIRLDSESFYDEDPNELTVDDFASLKKHGLVGEKKDVNEVPLIADEIDISPWKNLLMKFAQVHVCLEHLYRAETCLRADFASLKPISTRLLEHYVSDRSPIKTVGQLLSDAMQRVSMPIANNIVQDHLKKPASWYRVEMSRKENAAEKGVRRDSKIVYVFSQLPVFPPAVWQHLEPPSSPNHSLYEGIPRWALKYLDMEFIHEAAIVATWVKKDKGTTDVESGADRIRKEMIRICNASKPRIKRSLTHRRNPCWWSDELTRLREDSMAARRQYTRQRRRRQRDEDREAELNTSYRLAATTYKKEIARAKEEARELLEEPETEEVAEITTIGDDLKYHCTKYTFLSNLQPNKLPF